MKISWKKILFGRIYHYKCAINTIDNIKSIYRINTIKSSVNLMAYPSSDVLRFLSRPRCRALLTVNTEHCHFGDVVHSEVVGRGFPAGRASLAATLQVTRPVLHPEPRVTTAITVVTMPKPHVIIPVYRQQNSA